MVVAGVQCHCLIIVEHDHHWMFSMITISYILSKFTDCFVPGPVTGHSHVASIQRELVTPASVSPAPPTSSPSPDASGGTDLQVFDASYCSTLRLLRVDRMRKGELKEF